MQMLWMLCEGIAETVLYMIIRCYSDLVKMESFTDRFDYLKIEDGIVGQETFGYDRYLNQIFYNTPEWKSIRNYIISRDYGCDLGVEGYGILGRILIHHMNPITKDDILNRTEFLMDPEFLICTSFDTHQAIHYSKEAPGGIIIERTKNDTCPWKK